MKHKPEVAATIPSDTGSDMRCVALQWPAGEEYDTLLRSMLYLLTRGRFWAQETGSVKDAQSMGWRVFDANWPLVACDGGTSDNGSSDNGSDFEDILSGLGAAWEEEEMPCIDISGLLRIENGVLQARNSCCEWVTIGAMDAPVSEYPADVVGGQLPAEQDYSACGRAYAVSDAIFRVVDAVWDNKYTLPWLTIHAVETDAGMNLTGSGVLSCQAQAVQTDVLFDTGDVSDVTLREKFVCALAVQFAATGDGLSDSEWDAIKSACTGFSSVLDIFVNNLYLYVTTLAIGRSRLSAIAQLGAVNDQQDCDCPYEPIPFEPLKTGWAWSHYYDFAAQGAQGWEIHEHGSWVEGEGWVSDGQDYGYVASFKKVAVGAVSGQTWTDWCRIWYKVSGGVIDEGWGGSGWHNFNTTGATKLKPGLAYIDCALNNAIGHDTDMLVLSPYQINEDFGEDPVPIITITAFAFGGYEADPVPGDYNYS